MTFTRWPKTLSKVRLGLKNSFYKFWRSCFSKLLVKLLDASEIFCHEIATTINLADNAIFSPDGVRYKLQLNRAGP